MIPIQLTPEGAVTISYHDLVTSPLSLAGAIEQAFGSNPNSLGIIVVRDLPASYVAARERLLKLAYRFASLDPQIRERFADPGSRYSFGWSHGKEIMNGKPDTLKGSYYANPIIDEPNVLEAQREAYPEYYHRNLWPSNDVKEVDGFEDAFKELGRLIFQVGCELAIACQPFASPYLTDSSTSLVDLLKSSQTHKARLLHYFPPSRETSLPAEDEPIDSWCGFHLDHSLLTGLCSAMYILAGADSDPLVVPSPSHSSGLYVRTRGGALTKVIIPANCLAFQTGEALELATGGSLRATPHCVRVGAGSGEKIHEISRETFAFFMQPDTEQKIMPSETFGQFTKRILDEHYKPAEPTA